MSKLPDLMSSNQTDSTTVRSLHSMFSDCCSMAWMACAQSLKVATSRTRKSSPLMPFAWPAAAIRALASLMAAAGSVW